MLVLVMLNVEKFGMVGNVVGVVIVKKGMSHTSATLETFTTFSTQSTDPYRQ